jgi:hypothetical protein
MHLARNPVEYVLLDSSPLHYDRDPYVRRFLLVDHDLDSVPFQEGDWYFAEVRKTIKYGKTGKPLKTPRIEITAGMSPGTIGFVDWHFVGFGVGPEARDAVSPTIYIDFMKVRSDMRNTGAGRRLVEGFYEAVVVPYDVTYVDWGRIVSDHAWLIYEKVRVRYPHVLHHGKPDYFG